MRTFSVAEQTVVEPVTGATVTFEVDPADTAIVRCIIPDTKAPADEKTPRDYLRLTFNRNGLMTEAKMVDGAVEADDKARKDAAARVARNAPSGTVPATDEDKEKAKQAAEKQAADDKALLDSEPKVSKYATDAEKAAEGQARPRYSGQYPPDQQRVALGIDQQIVPGARPLQGQGGPVQGQGPGQQAGQGWFDPQGRPLTQAEIDARNRQQGVVNTSTSVRPKEPA